MDSEPTPQSVPETDVEPVENNGTASPELQPTDIPQDDLSNNQQDDIPEIELIIKVSYLFTSIYWKHSTYRSKHTIRRQRLTAAAKEHVFLAKNILWIFIFWPN